MAERIIRRQTHLGSPLAPPHHLALRSSRLLTTTLIAGHSTVLVALPLARPDLWVWCMVLLIPAVLGSLHLSLGLHALRYASGAVQGIEVRSDGSLDLICRDGERIRAAILGSSTVYPWLVVLNLRPLSGAEGRRWSRSVIIARDACDSTAFRRLRAWLRWGYRGPANEGSLRR